MMYPLYAIIIYGTLVESRGLTRGTTTKAVNVDAQSKKKIPMYFTGQEIMHIHL